MIGASSLLQPIIDTREPLLERVEEIEEEEQTDRPDINSSTLFILLFVFRMANAVLIRTWFDPDETWQSLEVAHRLVFGNGALTWEWSKGIRSALHPVMFASVYRLIQIMGFEHTSAIVYFN